MINNPAPTSTATATVLNNPVPTIANNPVIPSISTAVPASLGVASPTYTSTPLLPTSTPLPPTSTPAPVLALEIHNQRRTEVGGRTRPCDIAGNTKGAIEPGCEIVSSVSAVGATVRYTLNYADGSTQSFTDKTDYRGHSLHPFNVAYLPPIGSRHGQPATVAHILVVATLKDGTVLQAATRFAVIRQP